MKKGLPGLPKPGDIELPETEKIKSRIFERLRKIVDLDATFLAADYLTIIKMEIETSLDKNSILKILRDHYDKHRKSYLNNELATSVNVYAGLLVRDMIFDEIPDPDIFKIEKKVFEIFKYENANSIIEDWKSFIADEKVMNKLKEQVNKLEKSKAETIDEDFLETSSSSVFKIYLLERLGILNFLSDKFNNISNNQIARLVSEFTGIPRPTSQPIVNAIISENVSNKNHPNNNESNRDRFYSIMNQLHLPTDLS
ncbi:MAG: hypothetical protein RIC06_22445 [Cyclobacteriaceae bacterium]